MRETFWGVVRQPMAPALITRTITSTFAKRIDFIFFFRGVGYLAQLGCELFPDETRGTSLYCFVGTSSRDNTRRSPSRRVQTNVREFGDHDGSSPDISTVASPPFAG